MITYDWRGHNKRGQLQWGKAQVEPGQLLQAAQTTLDNGWITLSYLMEGDVVGGIRTEGGKRVAWAAPGL